ncbi:uncharacterized protein EURHEDRAFT_454861 [Aspergillus ruber CBS 135680]|uniref:Uncharacterized protein n=1 Tax=Aspergillus ruber (strain CBS 135680) TaxID=1388766 RepID=A0A017SFR5_ASPRC|nr:uncharacterized protein EURHEDRAFT_454861 [Aspergillus ruber CBS 135680]EYE95566.1 hypothetical protein EURHEDRAFT_454861 [Aspergillus ruber CBS 135680]
MPTTPPPPAPRPKSSRDQRLQVLTLRDAGFSYKAISDQLGLSYCQATPRKPKGQPPKLSDEDMDKVIAWISASKDDCRKPYSKVIEELRLEPFAQKRGHSRYEALQKPPTSQE